ncbi:MAG: hypothetical protein NTY63_00455 [Candidatus Bipolaricaulota bacterium]|nr:hypothetical protein [Candidatus Bipolaricaulota bacterium]
MTREFVKSQRFLNAIEAPEFPADVEVCNQLVWVRTDLLSREDITPGLHHRNCYN